MTTSPISCASLNRIRANQPRDYIYDRMLIGATYTGMACIPNTPERADAIADQFASYGQNWFRFHHIDHLLVKHPEWIERVMWLANALYSRGIRFSLDGCSELGLLLHGVHDFKTKLYEGEAKANSLYGKYLGIIDPLLRHPGCFLVCLVNEGAKHTTPINALTFWNKWVPKLREVNHRLLFTDCPDGVYADRGYWEVARAYDVLTAHYYNDDGSAGEVPHPDGTPSGVGNNIYDGWNWRAVIEYQDHIGKQLFVQEFGSYKSNPNQASNTAFVMAECARLGFHACQFAWATNDAVFDTYNPDAKFDMVCDPRRMLLALLGAHLARYAYNRPVLEFSWGGDRWSKEKGNWDWGNEYLYRTKFAEVTEKVARVQTPNRHLVWALDSVAPEWAWCMETVR